MNATPLKLSPGEAPLSSPDGRYHLKPHPRFGFLQVQPTPSSAEITEFYAKEFYSSHYRKCNDSGLEIQIRDKDFYDGHWGDLCANLSQLRKRPLKGSKILDIGCGWGQALLYFREQGMECYGFDPVPEAVAYARDKGLNVVEAGMESVDVFRGTKFDVVTLLNVLEHLGDPVFILKEIKKKLLKPGGLLVIDVPNEFNDLQRAGQAVHGLPAWWIAPPAHLNYFTPSTLRRLLEGLGVKVKRMEASFPMEMFLLFGHNYVKEADVGRRCHEQRMAFEMNLRREGYTSTLQKLYQALAKLNLGRQTVAYAVAP